MQVSWKFPLSLSSIFLELNLLNLWNQNVESFFFYYESREVHKKKPNKKKKLLIKFKRTKKKSLEGMSITWGSQTPQNKENI